MVIKSDNMRSLTAGEFQQQCLEEVLDFLKQIRIKESTKTKFTKREPTELLKYYPIRRLYKKCISQIDDLINSYPNLKNLLENELKPIVRNFYKENTSGLKLLDTYNDFAELKASQLNKLEESEKTYLQLSASKSHIYISETQTKLVTDPKMENDILEIAQKKEYLSKIMRICKDARERSRDFRPSEMCGIWSAYTLIKKGTTLDFSYKNLGNSGFRDRHHTLIFTTDPGDDHIRITSRSKQLMDGIAAHVEHIDRDKVQSKEEVEAYRLPAAINAAKTRLHIGDSVPVTAFIGRPVFENGNGDKPTNKYKIDSLKSVHMSASACSAMFQNGIADCKIAIERMYLKDAVNFMKSVVGNVLRTKGKQTLAAAFNLNTVYYDNWYNINKGDKYKELTDPYEIAVTAIKATYNGGFDRVTWDGASNEIPSRPIIDQLSHKQFVTLVHMAHEKGLQTYFSAGLTAEHVARCVYTGVDGLGIGTSLHYIDPDTKLMGAFNPEAIESVLKERNKAESTIKGKGAILLARLDRLYFEKILTSQENKIREDLFQAICEQDEEKIAHILSDENRALIRVTNMKEDGDNTIVERGKRTLQYAGITKSASSQKLNFIRKAIKNRDVDALNLLFEEIKEEEEWN